MKRWIVLVTVAVAALANAPAALGASSSDTFLLIAEHPNIGTAANGDFVEVTVDGGSWFDASPRAVSATGDFTHKDPDGNVLGAGTWTATSLSASTSTGAGVSLRLVPTSVTTTCAEER